MANKRIKDISTASTSFASDDFVITDSATSGTRKMTKDNLISQVSAGVSGDYLEESNNLSDVASKDTAKLNLEVPDIGSGANEVSLNGMLNSGAWVDWDSHYSEGTWDGVYVPATGTFASITMDADLGYVKNGKLVTVSGQIKTDALDTTGGSGQLKIDGLPFSASKKSAITIGFAWNFGSSFPLSGYISGSSIYLTTRTSTTARTDNFDVSGMTTGTSADRNNLYFSGTYQIA